MTDISPARLKQLTALTATQILAIPEMLPERLFTKGEEAIDHEYNALVKIWHPDRNKDPKAQEVFVRLTKLRKQAKDNLEKGIWQTPGLLEVKGTDGKTRRIKYLKKRDFELGEMYISPTKITYCIKPEYKDLFDNGEKTLRGLSFDGLSAEARKNMQQCLPKITASFATADRHVLVLEKEPDAILLADLMEHLGGKLDPRHAAWVTSRLHYLTCYLEKAGLSHNAIGPETVLVSPANHTAMLTGGWWYAAPKGSKLTALPTHTLDLTPPDVLRNRRADTRVDLELIRATARELLGDATGTTLKWNNDIPRPFAEWVTLPSSGNAVKDYQTWDAHVLTESFGPKRFVELNVKPGDVYPQP